MECMRMHGIVRLYVPPETMEFIANVQGPLIFRQTHFIGLPGSLAKVRVFAIPAISDNIAKFTNVLNSTSSMKC